MEKRKLATNVDPRIHRGVPEFLEDKGFSDEAVAALLDLDLALFQWRRSSEKGEFRGKVLDQLDETLEPALLQGLLSVAQIAAGLGGREPTAPTIGMVAETMDVDPSRASRIVGALVERGFLERRSSQSDGRRSVLALTAKAKGFMHQFSVAKWRLWSGVFEGWESEEIEIFSRLFGRYVDGMAEHMRSDWAADDK